MEITDRYGVDSASTSLHGLRNPKDGPIAHTVPFNNREVGLDVNSEWLNDMHTNLPGPDCLIIPKAHKEVNDPDFSSNRPASPNSMVNANPSHFWQNPQTLSQIVREKPLPQIPQIQWRRRCNRRGGGQARKWRRKYEGPSKRAKKKAEKKQLNIFLSDIVSLEDRVAAAKEKWGGSVIPNPTIKNSDASIWEVGKIMGLSSDGNEEHLLA